MGEIFSNSGKFVGEIKSDICDKERGNFLKRIGSVLGIETLKIKPKFER